MLQLFVSLTIILDSIHAVYLYDYLDDSAIQNNKPSFEEVEFEPVTLLKDKEKILVRNINCDDFSNYATNCTIDSALIYNSSRKSPPLPDKMEDWCKSLRHLMNCAIDWNSDCKDVTDKHFNPESIKGHMHVVNNICDDERFIIRYQGLSNCIDSIEDSWELCYNEFLTIVDEEKNKSIIWTHYETHFALCCARALFRRCTLETVFSQPINCTHEEGMALQKYSSLVSEGAVLQGESYAKGRGGFQHILTNLRDCDHNLMFENCPGGDPRPSEEYLRKFKFVKGYTSSANVLAAKSLVRVMIIILSLY